MISSQAFRYAQNFWIKIIMVSYHCGTILWLWVECDGSSTSLSIKWGHCTPVCLDCWEAGLATLTSCLGFDHDPDKVMETSYCRPVAAFWHELWESSQSEPIKCGNVAGECLRDMEIARTTYLKNTKSIAASWMPSQWRSFSNCVMMQPHSKCHVGHGRIPGSPSSVKKKKLIDGRVLQK